MTASPQVVIFYFALLWLKVTSYKFDCNKLLDVCPGETVQVYCRDDNEPGSTRPTIMWRVRSFPNKYCWVAFGVQDLYGTVKELSCHGRGRAELLSKVPNSTNLTLHLTPGLASVTCRSTISSASKVVCPITFKGKPSPPANVSYIRQRDDQVLVMWSSAKEITNYTMSVTSSQTNESYNMTLHKNSALLTIKGDVDYNITVTAFNCAGESLPSEPIMILSTPDVNVAIKNDNLTITWSQTQDECFIIKIEDKKNLECSKRGSLSRNLTSRKLYEIELLSKANGSLVTGSLWRKQYCVAYSVSPRPLVNAVVSNDTHNLQVNVTVRSHCDPGELLQDCLCPIPSEIILQLGEKNKTHYDPMKTTINIDLSDMSSESAVVFGTVWVKNDCGMSEGVHFFAHLPDPSVCTDCPSTDGTGCILPSLFLLLSLLILLALLFV